MGSENRHPENRMKVAILLPIGRDAEMVAKVLSQHRIRCISPAAS